MIEIVKHHILYRTQKELSCIDMHKRKSFFDYIHNGDLSTLPMKVGQHHHCFFNSNHIFNRKEKMIFEEDLYA